MPKLRIIRFRYDSGKLQREVREKGGKLHGITRHWHPNGQLAAELRYRDGVIHGVGRQWNHHGKPLGDFTIVHGTGTQRYWHETGQLKMEGNYRHGKLHGRLRLWLSDGTLVAETFHIEDKTVPRSVFLKTAATNPDWPQYNHEPAGKIARRTRALDRKLISLFADMACDSGSMEAKQWLTEPVKRMRRLLPKFRTPKAALRFVESLYAAGAESVTVARIYPNSNRKEYPDWLVITLPSAKSARQVIRKICEESIRTTDKVIGPEADIGEKKLLLYFDCLEEEP
jgi:hypothetical protein